MGVIDFLRGKGKNTKNKAPKEEGSKMENVDNGTRSEDKDIVTSVGENIVGKKEETVNDLRKVIEMMKQNSNFSPEDITSTEEKLRKEEAELADLRRTWKIGDSEEGKQVGENSDRDEEWIRQWINKYDTPGEQSIKNAIKFLNDIMFEEGLEYDEEVEGERARLLYEATDVLREAYKKSKERRTMLRTKEDAGIEERAPDKLNNPTEFTLEEFAMGKLRELVDRGIITEEYKHYTFCPETLFGNDNPSNGVDDEELEYVDVE